MDYYDDTLSYCLEDGTPLVYGIPGDRRASEHEPMTAVLPARDAMETAIEVDAGPAEPSDLVPSRRREETVLTECF